MVACRIETSHARSSSVLLRRFAAASSASRACSDQRAISGLISILSRVSVGSGRNVPSASAAAYIWSNAHGRLSMAGSSSSLSACMEKLREKAIVRAVARGESAPLPGRPAIPSASWRSAPARRPRRTGRGCCSTTRGCDARSGHRSAAAIRRPRPRAGHNRSAGARLVFRPGPLPGIAHFDTSVCVPPRDQHRQGQHRRGTGTLAARARAGRRRAAGRKSRRASRYSGAGRCSRARSRSRRPATRAAESEISGPPSFSHALRCASRQPFARASSGLSPVTLTSIPPTSMSRAAGDRRDTAIAGDLRDQRHGRDSSEHERLPARAIRAGRRLWMCREREKLQCSSGKSRAFCPMASGIPSANALRR